MRKFKNILLCALFGFMTLFSGFGNISKNKANAVEFYLTENEYKMQVQSILTEFCNFKTRVAGSENERDAAIFIRDYLKNNTFASVKDDSSISDTDDLQNFKFISQYTGLYYNSQNVVFEYKTSTKTDKKVILCCNYDAPCTYDNEKKEYVSYNNDALNVSAAGVAELIMLAKTLPHYNLNYNLEFVFFGAGECGFAGSEYYTNGLSVDEAKNVLCVINIDKIALGENLYFYVDEIETSFSNYVNKVISNYSKQIDLIHLNKTELVSNDLGLEYSHIALTSDNVKFMKRGIATINLFAGSYDEGLILGFNEYKNTNVVSYTENDTIKYINDTYGNKVIADNLLKSHLLIETLLTDHDFIINATKSYGQSLWFYKIFTNERIVLYVTIVSFLIALIVATSIYYKLTIKSYYANVEVEFLSSVVKITDHIDNAKQEKDVAKAVGQVIANDIKKDKTIKPEKNKK